MSRSQVASLVAVFVAIVVGTSGAAWWRLNPSHSLPAALEKLAPPAAPAPPPSTTRTASREPPAAPLPPETPSAPPAKAEAPTVAPSFDVVRIEPRGDTVVAGKGAPNTKVELMAGGKKVGEAVADAAGQFVILPPPLPPGDYDLTLRQDAGGRPADSKQSVAVSVPKPGQGSVVVALAEPGKATKLLSPPPPASSATGAAALPAGEVAIRSAELENGSGFYVTGTAKAGAHVHVYLNDAHIADVVAGPDGGWNVRVKRGLTGGHYVVRADARADGDSRAVASRAEVPFDVPVAMAEVPKPPPAAEVASNAPAPDVATAPSVAGAGSASGASAVVDSIATARVSTGDNLWNISRYRLGDGKRYTQIYAANAVQIRNPNLIFPGQVFVMPNR